MNNIPGIIKEDHSSYVLYYIEHLSDEFKGEIKKRLVEVCHGANQAASTSKIYSYQATLKEFIERYKSNRKNSIDRKKGMIGELLVHMILAIEGKYVAASPFFNMEEKSFKKGFDITLYEPSTDSLWITEIKSGEIKSGQKNASSAVVGLINSAKNDLKDRLNNPKRTLWLNALNAARTAMNNSSSQKDAVIDLLEQCSDKAENGTLSSNSFKVILSGSLFHPLVDRMDAKKVCVKQKRIINENLFDSVIVIAVQEETYDELYEFLESEVKK